jgi:prephenate dehydrogenase
VSLVRVGVAGLGLIGGSIARRLAEFPDKYEPIGYDIEKQNRAGLETADSIDQLAQASDMVVVAVPPQATASVIAAVLAADQNVLVTDVASVKAPIVKEIDKGQDRYVPSHPLAGAETSGWHFARPELLHATTWAVCPTSPSAPAEPFCRWAEVFEAFEARVIVCDPLEHDTVVARTSHAPHVAAAAIASSLDEQGAPQLAATLSGGALRGVARLASSDHHMWREVLGLNRDEVVAVLDEWLASLTALRNALAENRDEPIAEAWARGQEMAALVDELRWREPTWERREFDWPAWEELKRLGRQGMALRRPSIEGGRLSADVTAP